MPSMLRKLASHALLSLALIAPSVVRADDVTNRATAQALYDDANTLMAAGKYPEACKKLEESDRIFQGIGTRIKLGECFEKSDRFASAWTSYRGALTLAEVKSDPRVRDLRDRVNALEPRLSHLRVNVPDGSKIAGLKVQRDGSELPEGLWGASVPVDGGSHVIESTAPGRTSARILAAVKNEKDDVTVSIAPLTTSPVAANTSVTPPASASGAAKPTSAPGAASPEPPANKGGTQRTVGYVLGGVGVAGMIFGGAELLAGHSTQNTIDSKYSSGCKTTAACADQDSLVSTQNRHYTLGYVGLAAGGALTIAGAIALFTAPKNDANPKIAGAVTVLPGHTMLHVGGAW